MLVLNSSTSFSRKCLIEIVTQCRNVHVDKSARVIRQKFLDHFIKDNHHNFVRSSPVVPFCDPSIAFVNAGMNQFKSIFTGNQEATHSKVANSQKCVRVGGKHNDLSIVGTDGYHHTFFEMLGNWSFGDYFKREACELAWKLLVDVYKLPSDRLYVTYFKGDQKLGLTEDIETRDIWRKIGVDPAKILPFGVQENFWEMGDTGPCGPCTEIHFDHVVGLQNRSAFVNKGLFDLTELWNIVFIQFHRNPDGSITELPKKHVDTGMGFERLTAILQNKSSNYDTDNFTCLIEAIQKICNSKEYEGKFGEQDWNNLDTSYRILADHSRMVTACLADGVIPEQNQKLRRIMRKCFGLSQNVFHKSGLLKELSNYVVENLGHAYPEMERNISQIHQIIEYEEEVYVDLQNSAQSEWGKLALENPQLTSLDIIDTPNLIPAFKLLKRTNPLEINGELAFKLYDTFGLDKYTIEKLSTCLHLKFDRKGLDAELAKAKERSKGQTVSKLNETLEALQKENVPKTDDSHKYNYRKHENSYDFPSLDVQILRIIHQDDGFVKKIGSNTYCSLILDKTNFYTESGGQIGDKGELKLGNNKTIFEVFETENLNNYILHKGRLRSKNKVLNVGTKGTLEIDEISRLNLMRNHTATHLLNAQLKKMKGATCQKSSKVTEASLNLDVGIFGTKLTVEEIHKIEDGINEIIKSKLDVNIREINSQTLLELDEIITVPGEVYPDDKIRLVEIKNDEYSSIISREPCCGTHVLNTGDIEHFSIVKMKSLGRSTMSLHAVTGEKSKSAVRNGLELYEEIQTLKRNIPENVDKPDMLNIAVASIRNKINLDLDNDTFLPVVMKHKCIEELNAITKQIKTIAKETLNEFIDMEMQNVLESKIQKTKSEKSYIIHYLRTSMILENVPLQRATKLCKNIPIMVISYTDNTVQARCCVPKEYCNEKFSADKWMEESIASIFGGTLTNVKGQNEKFVCNMRSKRVNIQDWDLLLKQGLNAAKDYVENNL